MAIKVSLRKKRITEYRESLYLDFYPAIPHPKTGKPTRREFLGMYVFIDKDEIRKEIKEKKKQGKNTEKLKLLIKELPVLSESEKKHNTDTLNIAKEIKRKRQNFLNKPEIYTEYEKELKRKKELGEASFLKYFETVMNKRHGSNYDSWLSAYNYIISFSNGNLKFADLNESFFEDFKDYLLSTKSKRSNKSKLSVNTAVSYFNKVKAVLRQAYKDGKLEKDINAKIQPIKQEDTKKEYLTLDELNRLVKTECNNDLLKRASLFSALTGLRFSDIKKLTWKEIIYEAEQGYSIDYRQQKTKNIELLPISEQAVSLLEERGEPEQQVFEGLTYSAFQNKHLYQWLGNAGITKNITFHSFRHTFATLQLFSGTDITTVSKMLGHKSLKTTMIYAKIVDEAKRKAANKIKLDM
ncbi:MAG: site-specific integrase [Chlorobi bacterium]|nr:site-specific integrase [Chlorobiota bacterium]